VVVKGAEFRAEAAWGAQEIANMSGITTRLHWADQPYHWHINEGEEVFVVLSGQVNMHYRSKGEKFSVVLQVGDIYHATIGQEHFAEPVGEARILVVEQARSE